VQRLDQINAFKPANLFDFKSLTLKLRSEQIGRFKTAIQELSTCPARGFWGPYSGWLCCRTSWRQKRKDGRYDK